MKHKYDPNCPQCRPAILDPETGRIMEDAHPVMQKIMQCWNLQPHEVREAFIDVTYNNSREEKDVRLMQEFMNQVEAALAPKH